MIIKLRRYIKNQILECMNPGENFAIDLSDQIEQTFGVRYSPQRIGAHLHSMHDAREVTKESEIVGGCLRRHKWFKGRSAVLF